MNLRIELVPETAWGQNIRTEFTDSEWDIIRKTVYKRANYMCEICGGKGDKHPVEAHEEWIYHEKEKKQKLLKITALCPTCHLCKHPGYANTQGKIEEVISHLMKINKISRTMAKKQIDDAFELWHKRNEIDWKLDEEKINEIKEWVKKQKINNLNTHKK